MLGVDDEIVLALPILLGALGGSEAIGFFPLEGVLGRSLGALALDGVRGD